MIFRNKAGELVSIKRNQYTSDTAYYKVLLETKQPICDTNKKTMQHHIAFILQNAKNMY